MQNVSYSDVVSAVRASIKSDEQTADKWKVTAEKVRGFYVTETALTETKAQFIADAIIPELKKHHRDALARELPRKNSKDYVEFVAVHGAEAWSAANEAKIKARATHDTYFARVIKYAFPPAKTDKQPEAPKTLETKIAELLNDAIGKCEKAEKPDFDVATCLTHLRAARAIVTKQ